MLKLRWTGCAGVEITWEGKTLLIDPYHTRLSKWKILFGRHKPDTSALQRYLEELPGELSTIVVGHTHLDHAMDVPALAQWCRGPVVGSQSLKNLAAISGMDGEVTATWGRKKIDLFEGASVTMIPSVHGTVFMGRAPFPGEIDPALTPPLKASQYRMGDMFIPKLEMGGMTFLHVGSANVPDEELAGHECDVLLVCVAGWRKTPLYIKRLVDLVQPKVIIPIHFDDISRPIRQGGYYRPLPFLRMKTFMAQLKEAAPRSFIRKPRPFQTMLL